MDRARNQTVVFLNQAAEEAAKVANLLGGIVERDVLGQNFAGDLGEDLYVGMHDGGPEVLRHGNLCDVEFFVRADENDATEQAGRNVVGMPCTIGTGFTGHGEW